MQIPIFPECDRDLIQPLAYLSDYDLVNHLQQSPSEGKYFTALFCRYSPVVYSLIRHSARSPVQANYLFALTWRLILNELSGINLSHLRDQSQEDPSEPSSEHPMAALSETSSTQDQPDRAAAFSLQGWLINLTAAHINQAALPDVESIHYSLADAPPPLWCYTERALENLSPMHRLIILMAQTFAWSNTRISAYLQAEGDRLSPDEVQAELKLAYQALERAIPADIRKLYVDSYVEGAPAIAPATAEAMQGTMTIEFDEADLQTDLQSSAQTDLQTYDSSS